MTAVLDISSVSLFLTGYSVTLLLAALAFIGMAVACAFKTKVGAAAALGLAAVVGSAMFLANSLLASPSSWQVIYAAVKANEPAKVVERANDIKNHWIRVHDGILVKDWYFLATRWGVCHELWPQSSCTRVPAAREPMGVARELLGQLANGA